MWIRLMAIVCGVAFVVFILSAFIGYHLLKYVFKEMRTDHFDAYTTDTAKVVDKLGDATIQRAYVMRKRLPRYCLVTFYVLHLFLSEGLRQSTLESDIFHEKLLLEVKDHEGTRFIVIEKSCELVVRESFHATPSHSLEPIQLSSEPPTVSELLAFTRKGMGDERFYNWRTDSTCQDLVAEMVAHLDSANVTDRLNPLDHLSTEDKYILNQMLFHHHKLMRMLRLDRFIMRMVT